MESIDIEYRFRLPDCETEIFQLSLEPTTLHLQAEQQPRRPDWTKLGFHRCPHCPLSSDRMPYCPVALNLATCVGRLDHLLSYDSLAVAVVTPERQIVVRTTAERALSSLMGLLIATSACPLTDCFKPMARFHLPFASEAEALCRGASLYLLGQYFAKQAGAEADLKLAGLRRSYEAIHTLNKAMADRLRSASQSDSMLNAMSLLDALAKNMPMAIEESLEELRPLFACAAGTGAPT